jgi:DNA-binding response OmpR family regulator
MGTAALKERTVLVIEDDAGMREFLKSALAPENFVVYTADGGEDGVKQALARRPDLILLDLVMPGVDGVAVCKALRKNKETETIPILVATGTPSTKQIEDSIVSGADDFVSKPIDVRDLIIRVRAMLQCKDIADPIKRLSRYTEIVRENTATLPPPTPPDTRTESPF